MIIAVMIVWAVFFVVFVVIMIRSCHREKIPNNYLTIPFKEFLKLYYVDTEKWYLNKEVSFAIYTTEPKEWPNSREEYKSLKENDRKGYELIRTTIPRLDGLGEKEAYQLMFEIHFPLWDRWKYQRFLRQESKREQTRNYNQAYSMFLADVQENIQRIQKQNADDMKAGIDRLNQTLAKWR